MLLHGAEMITDASLAQLLAFVAIQVRRIVSTHQKTTWEYHHEIMPAQDFSPWLFLDEHFWLHLKGSNWWLDYGGTGGDLVEAAVAGRATDQTDVWLLTDIFHEVEGEVSTFRSRFAPRPGGPAFSRKPGKGLDDLAAPPRRIDWGKLTVWRITFVEPDPGTGQPVPPPAVPTPGPLAHARVDPERRGDRAASVSSDLRSLSIA